MKTVLAVLVAGALALAAVAVMAPPAGAATVTDPQIDQWIGVARAFWGQSPCDRVTVTNEEATPLAHVWAVADRPGCRIILDPTFYPRPASQPADWWEAGMCHIVVHEFGHLLNRTHAADGIMKPGVDTFGVRGCPQYANYTGTYFTPTSPAAAPAPVVRVKGYKATSKKRKRCARYVKAGKHRSRKHRKRKCRVYRVR